MMQARESTSHLSTW